MDSKNQEKEEVNIKISGEKLEFNINRSGEKPEVNFINLHNL